MPPRSLTIYIFDSAPQFPKIKSLLPGPLKIIAISPWSLKLNRLSSQLAERASAMLKLKYLFVNTRNKRNHKLFDYLRIEFYAVYCMSNTVTTTVVWDLVLGQLE